MYKVVVGTTLGGAVATTTMVYNANSKIFTAGTALGVGSGSSSGVKNMSIRAVDSRIQINLNGREIAVSSEISAKIFETLKRKNKIEAIKLLRTEYGLELIEAKGLVDTLSQSTT
jgi:ribosomal protein L7/L12